MTGLDSGCADHSVGLDGRSHRIPGVAECEARWAALAARAAGAREAGREVVVIQGLGFVGAVMAAVCANARAGGEPCFFVIGVDLPRPDTYWKVGTLLTGEAPVVSSDPKLVEYIRRGVLETGNLTASVDERVYGLADVVVVDIHLDVESIAVDIAPIRVRIEPFERSIRVIGRHMRPDALVLVETTVPPGTTSSVVVPALRAERRARGLEESPVVAHSYERVMPGPNYVGSVERYWRSFAADDERSAARAEAFLSKFIDTEDYPLRRLGSTVASETAKVLENSYRAANIAFIHEWALAAERMGIDLFEVVESIRVRKGTHDNMMRPGFGVGGYCLPKDGLLAQWGLNEFFGGDVVLHQTLNALSVNRQMPIHTFDLLRSEIPELAGTRVHIAGVSYLADVADTRFSPTERLCELLEEAGAVVTVSDPFVKTWPERPRQAFAPLATGVREADAVVFAVRHRDAADLEVGLFEGCDARVVLDAHGVLTDRTVRGLRALGHRVVGVGRGNWIGDGKGS